MLNAAHLFHWSTTIFQHNPRAHIYLSHLKLEFKNSTTTEIRILRSQPFTNSNFHSLITMESATPKTLRDSNSVPPIARLSHPPFKWRANRCNHHHHHRRRHRPRRRGVGPFSNFRTHCTIFDMMHTQQAIKRCQNASIIIWYKWHKRKARHLGPTPELLSSPLRP